MDRSIGTGTLRSLTNANKSVGGGNTRTLRQQRTATSNRTGGVSSSAQTSVHYKAVERHRPKIFDEYNNDVTPKSLFGDTDSGSKTRHTSGIFHSIEGTSTPTDILSNGSVLNTNPIFPGTQPYGTGFYESSMHPSTSGSDAYQQTTAITGGVTAAVVASDSSHDQGDGDESVGSAHFYADNIDGKRDRGVKDDQEEASVETIGLKETSTFVLLSLPSICVHDEDTEKVEQVKANNQRYLEVCKNKVGNDSYVERGINTFNDAQKLKSTQTERIGISEKGVVCNIWDIYDTFKNKEDEEKDDDEDSLLGEVDDHEKKQKEDKEKENKDLLSNKKLGNHNETVEEIGDSKSETLQDKTNLLLSNELKKKLFFMERFVNSTIYQPKQAFYRGMENLFISPEEETSKKLLSQPLEAIGLEKLWTYSCELNENRNVSCLTWNRKNMDIVAAGYGKFEYNDELSGLVCCWSIKNTEYPERYYNTNSGVTALAFSNKYPNLLAVGLFNGNILVYDVRNNNTKPLISTNDSDHRHLSPVWNLKWAEKERSTGGVGKSDHTDDEAGNAAEMEVLISISSDGRVTQWMIRKGFESTDYLKLKRIGTTSTRPAASQQQAAASGKAGKQDKPEGREAKSDGLISRHAGGLCFDVWEQDKSIYLCGTEEGFIHRCSTSYNEQYLDTYKGHTGPVYKLAWSPFLKNCFLSASGDWSIRLWKMNRTSPCLSFSSASKAVYDISWSPNSATLFCAVNENALELWDLSRSTLDPIFTMISNAPVKLTTVGFSPNSDSLVVGSSDGSICIYGIKNKPPRAAEEDLEEIIKHSLISQMENFEMNEEDLDELTEKYKQDPIIGKLEEEEQGKDGNQMDKLDAIQNRISKIKNEKEKLQNKDDQKPGEEKKDKDKKKKKQNQTDTSSSEAD